MNPQLEIETSDTKEPKLKKEMSIRISLPKEIENLTIEAFQKLKERKKDARLDELFDSYLLKISKDYFESQIERLTPDEFYLEQLKTNPDLLSVILKQARKLASQSGISTTGMPQKKRGRKPKQRALLNT